MNLRVSSLSGNFIKCDKDADESSLNSIFAQYGIEPGFEGLWEEIIKLDGPNAKKRVDMLLERLQKNSKENGFFDANQPVIISYKGFGFKLDDYNIYYMFFNNLKSLYESEEGRQNKGSVVFNSIRQTIKDYFGGTIKYKCEEKASLTVLDEKCEYPSISKQRNNGTASASEMSAIAHNLWLLVGKESFYINSKKFKLDKSRQKCLEDGCPFNIVNTGNGYRLCDFITGKFLTIDENPIELIKQNKSIKFGSETYYLPEVQSERTL